MPFDAEGRPPSPRPHTPTWTCHLSHGASRRTINYYGRFYRTVMNPLLQRVNTYMRRWAGRKYKRLRTIKRFKR
jgi:S-adenosylmethionine:diacylglycerol 3-amino-3-carboxypropyl transferase